MRTRHHLPHFLNGNLTEVSEMHHGEHTTTAAHCDSTRSFNLLGEELGNFVGVDVS